MNNNEELIVDNLKDEEILDIPEESIDERNLKFCNDLLNEYTDIVWKLSKFNSFIDEEGLAHRPVDIYSDQLTAMCEYKECLGKRIFKIMTEKK